MDWASENLGELYLPGAEDQSQANLHWLLSATGIWEELRHLEEEQKKLQRTLQDVLRRRQVIYPPAARFVESEGIAGRTAMFVAAGLAFLGFLLLALLFSGQSLGLEMVVLGVYISAIVAVLAGALFSN